VSLSLSSSINLLNSLHIVNFNFLFIPVNMCGSCCSFSLGVPWHLFQVNWCALSLKWSCSCTWAWRSSIDRLTDLHTVIMESIKSWSNIPIYTKHFYLFITLLSGKATLFLLIYIVQHTLLNIMRSLISKSNNMYMLMYINVHNIHVHIPFQRHL
jgi:hypothetical protein